MILLDGVGEALILDRMSSRASPAAYLFARVAHRDAEAAAPEHHHVVGLVANRRDGSQQDLQVARQPLDDHALVGRRVRDVEVVWLRARGGDLRAEDALQCRFARRDFVRGLC